MSSDGNFAPDQGSADLASVLRNGVKVLSGILQALQQIFPSAIGTSTSATGGSATLPGNPVGFIEVKDPATGNVLKVPFYAP